MRIENPSDRSVFVIATTPPPEVAQVGRQVVGTVDVTVRLPLPEDFHEKDPKKFAAAIANAERNRRVAVSTQVARALERFEAPHLVQVRI